MWVFITIAIAIRRVLEDFDGDLVRPCAEMSAGDGLRRPFVCWYHNNSVILVLPFLHQVTEAGIPGRVIGGGVMSSARPF